MSIRAWFRPATPPVRGGYRAALRRVERDTGTPWRVANAKSLGKRIDKAKRLERDAHAAMQHRFWGSIASILRVLRG